ncbi:MAG: hypothetical protein QGH20_00790, partial [Candidatus Latescibacteria bacterium]|nr:hypothetical protein [Candidatus Latescibacterota bacterium]
MGLFRVAVLSSLIVGQAQALVVRGSDGVAEPGCGTFAWSADPEARVARIARPNLDRNHVSPSGLWRVHYNIPSSGASDPIDISDTNGSGVPDFVEVVVAALDSARRVYVEELGYFWNLNDDTIGGGPEFDVYCKELGYYYGYAYQSGYLEIDNDFAEEWYYTKGFDAVRVTVAHELFRSFQFQYTGTDTPGWLETTATFMEEIHYPEINDYIQYLDDKVWDFTFFDSPRRNVVSALTNNAFPYGAALFPAYLYDAELRGIHSNGVVAIRHTLEEQQRVGRGDLNTIVGPIEKATERKIADLLSELWVWNYFSGPRVASLTGISTLYHHDASIFPSSPEPTTQIEDLSTKGSYSGEARAEGLGAQLIEIVPDYSAGGVKIAVGQTEGDLWWWRLVVRRGEEIVVLPMPDGNVFVGQWDQADDILFIGANGWPDRVTHAAAYTVTYDRDQDSTGLPDPLVLGQNVPNPFNTGTSIPLNLVASAKVRVEVFDDLGRFVALLADRWMPMGEHEIGWDGRDRKGRRCASGGYVYRVIMQDRSQWR